VSFLEEARIQKPHKGVVLAYENRAAQLTGGGGLAALGLISLASIGILQGWGRIAVAVFGVVMLLLGLKASSSSMIRVAAPVVELRWAFQTKKVPIASVDRCVPRCDSKGLMAQRCYPELVLKTGVTIPFNAVQWSPQASAAAAAACAQITVAI